LIICENPRSSGLAVFSRNIQKLYTIKRDIERLRLLKNNNNGCQRIF
jgi:hypothetical protein